MIRYKAVPKTQPGIKGGGEVKYCAAPTPSVLIDFRDLAKEISTASTFSRGDIYGLLNSFVESIVHHITIGDSVRLGDLGIFSLSISSDLRDTPEEINQKCIRELRLKFRPGVEIKKELKLVELVKARSRNQ